ncbi:unnamed protein product [Rotaria sordida]|uniref:Uncharacterized protein n=1 Tax=Rotaria sordida TaxID=392033 RepID=A0A819Y592_9BILA|nr:unnamed protein product [Rotaria sordida]CAF1371807.1 unnamed protein product [Rotaria sordida]CAF1403169.1 unnamed protein product [Rotaria sordida]CAF1492062.1 unnamed protein product [Rotaria sordida]CAF1611994.1 unnamed protein product [Rotaria sordida]
MILFYLNTLPRLFSSSVQFESNIYNDIITKEKNERAFKDWFDKESSDLSSLPETYENLNIFHRFLFARCISPDRTISEARNYIQDTLGIEYSEIPVLSLELI